MTLVGDPPYLFSIHRASPVRGLFFGFSDREVRALPQSVFLFQSSNSSLSNGEIGHSCFPIDRIFKTYI